jgi:hypothetical protein
MEVPNNSLFLDESEINGYTLDEYILLNNFKPLTDKEIEKGKANIKIYGTLEPMPWATIYTRLSAGQPIEEIVKMYGHKRQIALWAQLEGIAPQQPLVDIVEQEVAHRKQISALANVNPDAATTLMMMVNEIAPDFTQKVALFSEEVVDKSRKLLKGKFVEATDILNLAKAVQTVTDSVGVTTRHASAVSMNNTKINVTGFAFIPDIKPEEVQPQDDGEDYATDADYSEG